MSTEEIIVSAVIQAVASRFGKGGFVFCMGVSSFAGTMAQVAVMKWGFSEKQGMMLATAISVGASWGAGGAPEGLTSALGDSVTAGIATVIIGMAVGAVQGYLQYEIAEWLDGQLDEDMNSAIRQGIIGIASSLGASLATTMVVGGISSAFSAGAKGKPSTTNAADLKSMSSGNSTGEGVGQGGLSTQQTAGDGVFIGAKEGGDGTGTGIGGFIFDIASGFMEGIKTGFKEAWKKHDDTIIMGMVSIAARLFLDETGLVEGDSLLSIAIGDLVGLLVTRSMNPKTTWRDVKGILIRGTLVALAVNFIDDIEDDRVEGDRAGDDQKDRVNLLLVRGLTFLVGAAFRGIMEVGAVMKADISAADMKAIQDDVNKSVDARADTGEFNGPDGKVDDDLKKAAYEQGLQNILDLNYSDGMLALFFRGAREFFVGDEKSSTENKGFFASLSDCGGIFDKADSEYSFLLSSLEFAEKMAEMNGWTATRTLQLAKANEATEEGIRKANQSSDVEPKTIEEVYEILAEKPLSEEELEEKIENQKILNLERMMNPFTNIARHGIDSLNSALGKALTTTENNVYLRGTEHLFTGLNNVLFKKEGLESGPAKVWSALGLSLRYGVKKFAGLEDGMVVEMVAASHFKAYETVSADILEELKAGKVVDELKGETVDLETGKIISRGKKDHLSEVGGLVWKGSILEGHMFQTVLLGGKGGEDKIVGFSLNDAALNNRARAGLNAEFREKGVVFTFEQAAFAAAISKVGEEQG
ncbi:MAG: hypothetical protein KAR31_03670, partial [Candidatus Omnitrophica bacterium]|nr:hypothetical protein [Candidatus Omnitrophota bacterium]